MLRQAQHERMNMKKLIKLAIEARKKAYAPYSRFKVGAALEAANGKIYTGCNVENSSYGITVCAERVALFKAVSEGVKKFKKLVIVADTRKPCPPCGICRQALIEFAPHLEIVMANTKGKTRTLKLADLLPHQFSLNNH